jgi:arylsulfatase A-like enzyme
MTDHGLSHARGKQFLYDEGTHIPFILSGPGVTAGGARTDLVEHIDMAATALAAAGIPIPEWMQGRDLLDSSLEPRAYAFAARDRCDETVDRIRSLRSNQYLYIRNGHPGRPMLQPNDYKDRKPTLIALRRMRAEGTLPELSERLLFAPNRPVEELYDYRADPFQMHNLAANPAYESVLAGLRQALDETLEFAGDPAPETAEEFDDAMAEYLRRPNPQVEENIRLMKAWADEGR